MCLVAAALGGYVVLRSTLDRIGHIKPVDNAHRPPRYNDALNILLLGSDTRNGQSTSLAGQATSGCNCSDTIMLVHISPGRGKAVVLSIPRDTMVPIYACAPVAGSPGQQQNLYALEQINWTLEYGGPECVRTTVEQQTGIYINNVVQLNFTGFVKVIDDVGGVNICVPVAIRDPVVLTSTGEHGSGLVLSAGRHHINGITALKFWRARYALADGTDTARIERDQYLMAQVLQGVLRSGLLGSPTKLYSVARDTAASMSTDASISDLVNIAASLRGLSSKNVQFITAPYEAYPPDPNQLEFAQPDASIVFSAIAYDRTLPKISPKKSSGTSTKVKTVSPAQVKVMVLNGTTAPNLAGTTATGLTGRGFTVTGIADTATPTWTSTVVEYGTAADLPAANTVREQFDATVTTKLVPSLTPGTVQLILGTTGSALLPVAKPGAKPAGSSVAGLAQAYNGITGNVGCRNSAFFGPNLPAPVPTSSAGTTSSTGSTSGTGSTASSAASCPC